MHTRTVRNGTVGSSILGYVNGPVLTNQRTLALVGRLQLIVRVRGPGISV